MKKYLLLGLILLVPITSFATSIRSSSSNSSSTGTAISITAPSGTVTNDVVVCVVHGNGQTTIVDNNGGTPFTEDINDYKPNTVNGHTMSIFSRRIKAGDPSTYNFTLGTSGRWAIVCSTVQDPNTTYIYDVAPNTGTNATNRDLATDGLAVTTSITASNNSINFVTAGWDTSSIGTITTPTGYTLSGNGNGGGEPLHLSWKLITPSGSTGTQNINNTEAGAYITFSFSVPVATTTATSTVYLTEADMASTTAQIASLNFGITIIIVLMFMGMITFAWNSFNTKKKWQ